ncbi:matrixin family metalloprotease [[Kitasatospora] papulosa]|uniref:matrixin family metalloprotease n=1 Tax=[Kitasatospora] papulosa TaxID=1464011 RepID=UPI003682B73C
MARNNWRLAVRGIAAFALAASVSFVGGGAYADGGGLDGPQVCPPATGDLTVSTLPAGTSVISCPVVGRVVTFGGTGVTVPEPNTAVGVDTLTTDGESMGFSLEVSADGVVSYNLSDSSPDAPTGGIDAADSLGNPSTTTDDVTDEPESVDPDALDSSSGVEPEIPDLDSTSATGACSDGAYSTNDLKEYGTYNWYIGDGGMPGGLSRGSAQAAFADAINNITGSYNNCGYGDSVSASSHYSGTTTYEADINSSSSCTARDGKSTWDAGNLKSGVVATTCWWSWPTPGVKNDLREADVRFNTTDYDFTNSPTSSCSNLYDIRSVGTHEAGHVFGMGHVSSAHSNLTMTTNSIRCSTIARTLGKGDVLGLRSIY